MVKLSLNFIKIINHLKKIFFKEFYNFVFLSEKTIYFNLFLNFVSNQHTVLKQLILFISLIAVKLWMNRVYKLSLKILYIYMN